MLSAQNQHFGWFHSLFMVSSAVLFGFNVFSTQNSTLKVVNVWFQSASCSKAMFWVVPFTCHGSQYCLAPKCFQLKINILGGSLHFLWFPVLFGSNVFSTQNSTFKVVNVWLQSASCSKSMFWVVPFTCHGSQCYLVQKCFLLKINIFGGSLRFLWCRGPAYGK